MSKKTTEELIGELARMTERGFEEAAKSLHDFRAEVREKFQEVDQRFDVMVSSIDALHEEVREIKVTLPPLVRTVETLEVEVQDLRGRVERLEKKVGLAR